LVEDAEVRSDGRKVRCSACGEEWRAFADDAAPPADVPDHDEPAYESADEAPAPDVFVESAMAEAEVAMAPIAGPRPLDGPGPAMVTPIATSAPRRRSSAAPAVLVAALVLIAAVVLAIVLRTSIVRAFPAAAPIYAHLGLPAAAAPHD
jgi:hypothetical protein